MIYYVFLKLYLLSQHYLRSKKIKKRNKNNFYISQKIFLYKEGSDKVKQKSQRKTLKIMIEKVIKKLKSNRGKNIIHIILVT